VAPGCWRVEVWVQPTRHLLSRWCGRRCGPWREYAVVWAWTWEDIPSRVLEVESAGMYHRLMVCAEAYDYDEERDAWLPVDHV